MEDSPATGTGRGRRIGVGVLLVLATLFWIITAFGVWAQRQALDTDNWVDTSTDLLENEQIRTALGVYLVDQVFSSADLQSSIEEVLPPRLDRLAGPAAAGLEELARRNAPRLLGSAAALNAWSEANRVAHNAFINLVENGGQGSVSINMKDLAGQLAQSVGVPASVADRLPADIADLTIAEPDQLQTARDLLDLFKTLVWVLLFLSLACFAGAIGLSRDRRRTIVTIGGCLIFAGIAIFAVRTLMEKTVVDALAKSPNASAVGDDIWNIATSLLVDVAQGTFLFGLFVMTGAWLAGEGRRATAARRGSAHVLREHPGWVRAGLGALLLLLVLWGPVPWTQRFWTMLIFTVVAFAWLEWIRRRTLEEFPDQPPPRMSLRLPGRRGGGGDRSSELERLASLRDRGVLDQAEFDREKAALLGGAPS